MRGFMIFVLVVSVVFVVIVDVAIAQEPTMSTYSEGAKVAQEQAPAGELKLVSPDGSVILNGIKGEQGPAGTSGERGPRGYAGMQGKQGPAGILPLWAVITLCSAVLVSLLCSAYLLGARRQQPTGYPPVIVQMGGAPIQPQPPGQPQPPANP